MKVIKILESFTPGFIGSLMGGILLAIILGQSPVKNIEIIQLFLWIILLFVLGILFTWSILKGFEK